jgi:hypothetical protein
MAVDYATLLANAQTALNTLLAGAAVVEWSEGGHKTRITEPDKLLTIIERLEVLAAEQGGASPLRPIVTVES